MLPMLPLIAAFNGPTAAFYPAVHSVQMARRMSVLPRMAEEPTIKYDANSGWKPNAKSDAHGGSAYEATDTPDFFDDDGYGDDISYTDGMMGSTGLDKLKQMQHASRSSDPGVAGALDINPDVYEVEIEELSASKRGITFELKPSGQIDLEVDFAFDSLEGGATTIDVRPVCMTFEEFYCGFTSDTPNCFSVSPSEGYMERRNGPPTTVTVSCTPNGRAGTYVGYLCFILPEEKAFSTYYKITANAR